MESKKRYKTKQYDELVEYISSIPGQHFTVNELYMHFAGKDKAIGVTPYIVIYSVCSMMVL